MRVLYTTRMCVSCHGGSKVHKSSHVYAVTLDRCRIGRFAKTFFLTTSIMWNDLLPITIYPFFKINLHSHLKSRWISHCTQIRENLRYNLPVDFCYSFDLVTHHNIFQTSFCVFDGEKHRGNYTLQLRKCEKFPTCQF